MDYSEKWGTTIEEAVKLALIDLKLTKEEVKVTVLEEPTKGFFGIGSKLAKVRVEKMIEEKPSKKIVEEKISEKSLKKIVGEKISEKPVVKKQEVVHKEEKMGAPKASRKEETLVIRERPSDLVEVQEHAAVTFLKEVTEKMGLDLSIKGYKNEGNVYVDIEGKDSGTIIGKRGQTLDAIQYLTSLIVNRDKEKYIRVVVDAENYRQKREKTLEQLANRLGDKVLHSKKSVRLEPMNPYERKVIHATLQSKAGIVTRSEGEEPYRRVIIELK
ncbi:RNA-binding cell elongation regulator Jag/EloR [Sinanaerobacter sp. ZZT-01]|uniref:RNA-binding cell elongation regulator Jag/EloR n=1 Tax=Sinanaerobacter sp. ZZT-01 TaxID=3111540 RepID=UPI002D7658C8|nr:RNA-binding cell elongation regulator Jag/EloR [Sinanaerobacter sp. ZZT-01]WRR94760.1 RNA-binding cell elongation regulator Jag/EloR [Sinanaerobacter sp. ZZT-01]